MDMTKKEAIDEALLDGWLSMSMSIWNERLVTAMTYNESLVCNRLYKRQKQGGEMLTATELCASLRIRKPQMNVILNGLEKNGLIARVRSRTDKRNVYLALTEEGKLIYEKAHQEILRIPAAVSERLGEEKSAAFAALMKEVASCFNEIPDLKNV